MRIARAGKSLLLGLLAAALIVPALAAALDVRGIRDIRGVPPVPPTTSFDQNIAEQFSALLQSACDGVSQSVLGNLPLITPGFCPDAPPPPPQAIVLISEIAWMGSMIDGAADANAEWIELMNTGDADADLSGWTLVSTDGNPNISLSACANTILPAGGFFLLVRAAGSIGGVDADCTYPGGVGATSNQLENGGEDVELRNALGELVDNVPAETSGGWPAGNNTTKDTMQRTSMETWTTAAPTPGGPAI